jgi:hypothetical protein
VVARTIDLARLVVAAFVPTLVALARSIQFVALAWRQDQVGTISWAEIGEAGSRREAMGIMPAGGDVCWPIIFFRVGLQRLSLFEHPNRFHGLLYYFICLKWYSLPVSYALTSN